MDWLASTIGQPGSVNARGRVWLFFSQCMPSKTNKLIAKEINKIGQD
jgi:hypothetical protein